MSKGQDFDNWKGAYAEIKVADEMGAENIAEMGHPIPEQYGGGDIDILKNDGTLVEIKNINQKRNIRYKLRKQLPKLFEFDPSAAIEIYVPNHLVIVIQDWVDINYPSKVIRVYAI